MRSVFICGCGHSGTSLIANILAGHRDVFMPLHETGLFMKGADAARAAYLALCMEAERAGKDVLIEKTPRHISHLGLIREVVGAPLFIIPVRDGRDVAASLACRFGHLDLGIERWIADTSIVMDERASPDVKCYRHEDLVDDPAPVVREVCRFIGLSFSIELLEFHKQQRLWFSQADVRKGSGANGDEHKALRNWQINQPIFDNRGRWRSEWTSDDMRDLTEGRGRRLMERFGYL